MKKFIVSTVLDVIACRVVGYFQNRNVLLMFAILMYVTAVGPR